MLVPMFDPRRSAPFGFHLFGAGQMRLKTGTVVFCVSTAILILFSVLMLISFVCTICIPGLSTPLGGGAGVGRYAVRISLHFLWSYIHTIAFSLIFPHILGIIAFSCIIPHILAFFPAYSSAVFFLRLKINAFFYPALEILM